MRWVGVLMLVTAGVVALDRDADLVGIALPLWAHALAVMLALVMGLRFVTWAQARARSDDPAVAIDGTTLRLHVHPGRPLTLQRSEVLEVRNIERNETLGQRALEGERCFRINTTASGVRAMDLRIGERMVAAPLEEVHEAVAAFAGRPPTSR